MAHNFKLTGNIYVSKEGNDANAGTSPDAPKLTVQAGLNALTSGQVLVIGAGFYNENLQRELNNTTILSLFVIGDGLVIINGDGINVWLYSASVGGSAIIRTIFFKNIIFSGGNTIQVQASGGTGVQQYVLDFENCVIKNPIFLNYSFGSGDGRVNFRKTVFTSNLTISGSPAVPSRGSHIDSIYINSTLSIFLSMINCYIDPYSVVTPTNTISTNNFNFNNIQGAIIMNVASAVTTGVIQDKVGNYYDLSLAGTGGAGTIGDPFWRDNTNGAAFYFAEHRIAYPTFNTRSFSADPLFNDAPNLNFTLQSNSPHIKAASDYVSNIGGTEYAVYIAATDDELDLDATVTDLTLAGGAYTITSPATEGSVISAPIFLQWPIVKPLTKIEYTGGLEFNKSITPPAAGNNNVPAYDTYTTGAGANPDRLSIRMRYSTQQTEPTLDAHWDNGGYWPAGEWRVFELNAKPKIDVNGVGNGSPTYIESSSLGDLTPSWIQTEIVLRDDYLP
jgi:hypothetical protein